MVYLPAGRRLFCAVLQREADPVTLAGSDYLGADGGNKRLVGAPGSHLDAGGVADDEVKALAGGKNEFDGLGVGVTQSEAGLQHRTPLMS